ncbi:MAG: hypothetical protein AAF862_17325 [Pseudomonadota bacterium]
MAPYWGFYWKLSLLFGGISLAAWFFSDRDVSPIFEFARPSIFLIILLILGFATNTNGRRLVRLLTSLAVALLVSLAVTLFVTLLGPDEVRENLFMGFGEDRSTYAEYPIKTYWLLGVALFLLYSLAATIGAFVDAETRD